MIFFFRRIFFILILVSLSGCLPERTQLVFDDSMLDGITKFTKSQNICASSNEGEILKLQCPSGLIISSIVEASYGTPEGSCNSDWVKDSSCHIDAKLNLSSLCDGKDSCEFAVNNNALGEPCSSEQKRLMVSAFCYKPPRPVEVPPVTPNPEPENPVSGSSDFFITAYRAMEKANCYSCHTGSFQYGDLKSLTSEKSWVDRGYVVAGRPDESYLVKKLKNSGLSMSTMPPSGQEITESDFGAIKTWISHIESKDSEELDFNQDDQFLVEPRIMGIEQFLSQMHRIYGDPNQFERFFWVLTNNLRGQWGGGCDTYTASFSASGDFKEKFDYPIKACFSNVDSGPLGMLTVIKEGAKINTCEYFVDNWEFFSRSMNRFVGESWVFNKDNAEKIFSEYYPTISFTDAIFDNFVSKARQQYPGLDSDQNLKWRLFLTTLCQSSYWEVY